MARYRKRPVEIEAWRWDGGASPLPEWLADKGAELAHGALVIPTLEGDMLASPGDWIVQGVKGEVYPVKPDIFAATYDPV